MKVRLLLLATLLNTITVSGQFTTPISDSIFEQRLINLGYDTGIPNGEVLTSIIDTIDTLDISGNLVSQIITLSGIEYFTSLRYLDCSENSIDSLNLNSNSQLKHINCSSNDMSILEINNLNNLDVLNCSFNDLTAINLPNNNEIDSLMCYNNQLYSLDVSGNINIEYLYCGENNLTSLDLSVISQFGGLSVLECQNNPITDIDLSGNSSLKHLSCPNNMLSEINLSDNTNLQWLSIGNNLLDTNNNNNLNQLDLSLNCDITNLYCSGNANLLCIEVCDITQTSSWIDNIDSQQYYSNDCNYNTGTYNTLEYRNNIISIKDIYGRESDTKSNSILFFIYQDGTVKKQIILD